ncbi:MAG: hypothetical protein RL368_2094 [Pseudomonadota bacterium]|jgi:hypothetical protein
MKFVITSDCLEGGKHRAEGEVVEYTDARLISDMRAAGRIVEYGTQNANFHIKQGKERRRRKVIDPEKKWTLDRRLAVLSIILAVVGFVGSVVAQWLLQG